MGMLSLDSRIHEARMRKLLAAMTVGITLSACNPWVEAEYCAGIAAHHESDNAALAEMFDRFATAEGLSIDRSNPDARMYKNGAGDTELYVSFGWPDHDAIAAVFRSSPQVDSDLRAKLERFLNHEVAVRYKVMPCTKIFTY